MAKLIAKYGAGWRVGTDPIKIELDCIKRWGKWTDTYGNQCGMGLFHHVRELQKMLWPWKQWNRWNEGLILPELCKGGRLAIYGPSSSWKSTEAVWFGLSMYYANPNHTTVMCSSTTTEALNRRIFGYVKEFHKTAKEIYPDLPGFMVESKNMLITDGKDVEGRSRKNGVIGIAMKRGGQWLGLSELVGVKNDVIIMLADECFPKGTQVDTPTGQRNIEDIRPGDTVISACGPSLVKQTSLQIADKLVRITTKDGRIIDCTPNHMFFTCVGWKAAIELSADHYIFSHDESMQIVRWGASKRSGSLSVLLKGMRYEEQGENLSGMPEAICSTGPKIRFLWKALHDEMEMGARRAFQGVSAESPKPRSEDSWRENQPSDTVRLGSKGTHCSKNEGEDRRCSICSCEEKLVQAQNERRESFWRVREWRQANAGGESHCCNVSRGSIRACHSDAHGSEGLPAQDWNPALLQTGFRMAGHQACCGSGWDITSKTVEGAHGPEAHEHIAGAWVDSVEILQRSGDRRFDASKGGYPVYNLAVEGHPSYSVEGLICHNCQFMEEGFWNSAANIESNGEHTIVVALGNLPDTFCPLAKAAEPKLGWESLPETEKSRVYETRWFGGRAVQLIGMDSPNLDYPEDKEPFPKLIGRRFIRQSEHNYGKDTPLYHMFVSGKIPKGTLSRSVFTRGQCLKFHAMEQVTWGHDEIVRGYALDAAYKGVGGDRTVGVPFGFGKDHKGQWKLALLDSPKVYTGSESERLEHEDSIALQVRSECERYNIPPAHVFYDGTGRSSLTISFARLWSNAVVPIEFGGAATERPSFTGLRHYDGKKEGEVKTCREVYHKFVTELAFAVAACIVFDQMRGLTDEAVEEGCRRLWNPVAGGKIEVEPKDEMRLRIGRSCDLIDCVACAVEGARQLGFPLGTTPPEVQRKSNYWFRAMNKNLNEANRSLELTMN